MKYPRILAAIRSAKWAIAPASLQAIRDTLAAHVSGRMALKVRADEDMEDCEMSEEGSDDGVKMLVPGVACVRLFGIIGKHLSSMESECGGCDIARVEENLKAALANPMVATVILHIDSPGGAVPGVPDFAAKIKQMQAESGKSVWAFIDGQGCSAAYWIASACAGIACTTSSDVGSIGVYMALIDESQNWAEEGYKLVLIKAGEYKGAGMTGSVITPEQIALWQDDVNTIYAQFTGAVTAARPQVTSDTMQGQTFYGERALSVGLVDQICPDMDAMVAAVAPVYTSALS